MEKFWLLTQNKDQIVQESEIGHLQKTVLHIIRL